MFFVSEREVHGKTTDNHETPNWEPLLELAPEHVDDFMWMFSEGRAFAYMWRTDDPPEKPNLYREVDPHRMLREVLRRPGE